MAKPAKKQDTPNPTPKKKRAVASYKKARKARAARANPAPRSNPGFVHDVTHVFVPGFAAYGSTRVLQRIAFQLVGKRWPKWAKWAHAATGVATFGAVALVGHKVKALEPFHDAVLMGSGIAAAQGVASAILPVKYSWLLSDCRPEDLKSVAAPTQVTPQRIAESNDEYSVPSADEDEYAALEQQLGALSGGGQARSVPAPRPVAQPTAASDPDLMEELGGESLDDLYSGAFAAN